MWPAYTVATLFTRLGPKSPFQTLTYTQWVLSPGFPGSTSMYFTACQLPCTADNEDWDLHTRQSSLQSAALLSRLVFATVSFLSLSCSSLLPTLSLLLLCFYSENMTNQWTELIKLWVYFLFFFVALWNLGLYRGAWQVLNQEPLP